MSLNNYKTVLMKKHRSSGLEKYTVHPSIAVSTAVDGISPMMFYSPAGR